jgi:Fe-S cluster biogenesis protein NfuA
MAGPTEDNELRKQMQRIDDLLTQIDRFKDPQAQTQTRLIVQALMDFHSAAIERMLERIAATGETGLQTIDSIARDELVASLLLLYGLHPLGLESRVQQGLQKALPYIHSHGGDVELLGIDESVVRLRLHGSCHGCPSSAQTLKQTIEESILNIAPEITAIHVADETISVGVADETAGRFALPILAGH